MTSHSGQSSEIPEWTDSWIVNAGSYESMPDRRAFFDKWRASFEAGVHLDIQGNIGYVFAHMRQAIDRFKQTAAIDELRRCFERLDEAYGSNADVYLFTRRWAIHAYIYLRDYCGAWNATLESRFYDDCDIPDVIFYERECGVITLDGFTLFGLLRNERPITEAGEAFRSEIADVATAFLADYQTKHQCSVIQSLYSKLASAASAEEADVEMACSKVLVPFSGSPGGEFPKGHVPQFQLRQEGVIVYETVPLGIQAEIAVVLRRIVRESENVVRERHGLPKVGEGWVSEAELASLLSERFPDEKLVRHAQPTWLRRQHLDIYFPEWRVAVEFQGAQHEQSVALFGGEEAFKMQQERDARKKRLCEQNGCSLLYVYPGYSIAETVKLIAQAIQERRAAGGGECSDGRDV